MNYGINVYLLNQLTFPMIGIKLVFAKRISHKTSPFIPISHPKSFIYLFNAEVGPLSHASERKNGAIVCGFFSLLEELPKRK